MGSVRSKGPTQSIDSAKSDLIAPKFEDFLRTIPFVYPWMLPFLPSGRRVQDFAVVGTGSLLSLAIAIVLHELGFRDLIAGGVGMTGVGILTGESEARWIIASAKFGRAKELFRTKNSKIQQGGEQMAESSYFSGISNPVVDYLYGELSGSSIDPIPLPVSSVNVPLKQLTL